MTTAGRLALDGIGLAGGQRLHHAERKTRRPDAATGQRQPTELVLRERTPLRNGHRPLRLQFLEFLRDNILATKRLSFACHRRTHATGRATVFT